MNNVDKLKSLEELLLSMKGVAIAFSGGVDSTFLLKVAQRVLNDNVAAFTAVSYLNPTHEINEAKEFAKELGVKHIILPFDPIALVEGFKNNPQDRCYHCKKAVFSKVIEAASKMDINFVLDGTNKDDLGDYRPGMKAVKELGVRSPLLECGFTKQDIREYSKQLGIEDYNKPSMACLASRIPYNELITKEKLYMVEQAEDFIMSEGIRNIRVRCHGDLARIEVDKEELQKFFNADFIKTIDSKLKEYGFKYVSLDLAGYRTGSLNTSIGK